LELLDFGASREFGKEFIDDYLAVLKAAANLDREQCRIISLRLGYLTGRETEVKSPSYQSQRSDTNALA
jgi:aarF domain-containing kinase